MNKVDSLLKTPFHLLSMEEKLEIKRLGPHQPKDFLMSQLDGKKKRTFCNTWFCKKSWLTVSEEKQKLFCFYCVLFGGEGLWTTVGCKDLKHLSERIKKHEESGLHLENACKYKMFGTINIAAQIDSAYKMSVQKHNELVTKNRHILNRIVECLMFCGTHELALRAHNEKLESANRGNFLDLLSLLSNLDSLLHDHLSSSSNSVCKYTSHIIQNELLDCMYQVYIEELIKEINDATFVSVQADETTDITCRSQFVIILRYIKGKKPVERFLSFENVNDRTAYGLSEVLKRSLEPFNVREKLIAQAYDGAPVMSGSHSGVQTLMQSTFPHAKYVHCYAHQMNLVLQNACSKSIKSIRLFFANIAGFTTFFSSSPKRSDLLQTVCNKRIPSVSSTRWNFQSRIVNTVKENKLHLLECFEKIEEEDSWDDVTIREAFALRNLLHNPDFLFLLNFFYDIMKHVDIFYNTAQMQSANAVTLSNALHHFECAVSEIRENIQRFRVSDDECMSPPRKRSKCSRELNLTADAKEVCDIITNQMKGRFQNSHVFSSFEIIDPKKLAYFREHFPATLVNTLSLNYTPFICHDKLKNELSVIYRNDTFRGITSVCELFTFFVEHSLDEAFTEVYKTLQIALTTPISTAEAERSFSTLKRIKNFLRNSMSQERLNSLAVCSIHKEEISDIPNFNNRVIDKFASQKNRRAHLLYK